MLIYRNDLRPDLVVRLEQGPDASNLSLVDLSTAESIRMIGKHEDGTILFDAAPDSTVLGEVTHLWVSGETAKTGQITVEVEVTWPGTRPETWRAADFVTVEEDLA